MLILLDECIDERFRHLLGEHDRRTARFARLAGLTNGRLLDAADAAGFDARITVDQNIPHQQNLGGRRIAVIILRGATNRLRDLAPLVPAVSAALTGLKPGAVVRLE